MLYISLSFLEVIKFEIGELKLNYTGVFNTSSSPNMHYIINALKIMSIFNIVYCIYLYYCANIDLSNKPIRIGIILFGYS